MKRSTLSSPVPLVSAALQRYLEVRTVQNTHRDVMALQTRGLLSHLPAAEGYALRLLLQPGSASSDGPRADICPEQQSGSSSLTQLLVCVSCHPGISLTSLSSLCLPVIGARPSSTGSAPLWSSIVTPINSEERQV